MARAVTTGGGSGANSSRQELEAGWTEEVGRNESSSLSLFLA